MGEYSSLGRTMVVYAAVFTEVEQSLRFRRTNPRVLLALFTVSSMCFLQVRSSLMVTPKYLLLSTTSSVFQKVEKARLAFPPKKIETLSISFSKNAGQGKSWLLKKKQQQQVLDFQKKKKASKSFSKRRNSKY